MATIPSNITLNEEGAIVKLDLNAGPHSFNFDKNEQALVVQNDEVGSITVNIKGAGVTNFACKGIEDQDVSAGYDIVVPSGEIRTLHTKERDGYLGADENAVTVTVTGVTGSSWAWLSGR